MIQNNFCFSLCRSVMCSVTPEASNDLFRDSIFSLYFSCTIDNKVSRGSNTLGVRKRTLVLRRVGHASQHCSIPHCSFNACGRLVVTDISADDLKCM